MYDPKCYELASEFLDTPSVNHAITSELAQQIQNVIEDFIGDLERQQEPEPAGSRDRDEWKHEAAQQQRLK